MLCRVRLQVCLQHPRPRLQHRAVKTTRDRCVLSLLEEFCLVEVCWSVLYQQRAREAHI